MRLIAKLAGGVAIVALAGNAALAADAIEAPPEPPAAAPIVIEQSAATWSGVYIGAFGGYNWAEYDEGDESADGWEGGAFAGVNWQNGAVIYGAEGDVGYSRASWDDGTNSVDKKAFGSLRARLGYAVAEPFMIYGTGGLALANVEAADATSSDSATHIGWTVGAGAEALLTDNIFGRLEYRYSDYGAKDYVLDSGTVSSGFTEHSVKAGIGLKF